LRALVVTLLLAGCGSPPPPASHALVVARPYDDVFNVPASYHGQPTPVVIMLHGYSANAAVEEAIFGLTAASESKGFIYAAPNGTVNSMGARFWNATDACCDEENSGVDDVAYINAVVDDIEWKYSVDPKRVFVTGHSNGGFMSHRLGCDSAARFAALVSLAGAQWLDQSKCNPTEPVAALQVHGDADLEVPYQGTDVEPGAVQTVADWAVKNGCDSALTPTGMTMDLVMGPNGNETTVSAHACTRGAAELWTMAGVGHVPAFLAPIWADSITDWMFAHPKP
jgi:polyhydroxybutyrate depolymerase